MGTQEIQQLIELIKAGKRWHVDISEGFIDIYKEGEKIIREEYQRNPYSGETRDDKIEMAEIDFTYYFASYSLEDAMKYLV